MSLGPLYDLLGEVSLVFWDYLDIFQEVKLLYQKAVSFLIFVRKLYSVFQSCCTSLQCHFEVGLFFVIELYEVFMYFGY